MFIDPCPSRKCPFTWTMEAGKGKQGSMGGSHTSSTLGERPASRDRDALVTVPPGEGLGSGPGPWLGKTLLKDSNPDSRPLGGGLNLMAAITRETS